MYVFSLSKLIRAQFYETRLGSSFGQLDFLPVFVHVIKGSSLPCFSGHHYLKKKTELIYQLII
jgi:hypothetical protein